MQIQVERVGTFIPKWQGNRDADDQIIVEYDFLSYEQRKRFASKPKTKVILDDFEKKTDEEIDAEVTAQHSRYEIEYSEDKDGLIAAMKPRVKGLTDQTGKAISTWAELLAVPHTPWNKIKDLIAEITSELVAPKDDEKKTLE
jgi:hypothetical protein